MAPQKSWREVRQHFRDYYTTAPYYTPGKDWQYYAAAYRLGWQAASSPEYQGQPWPEIESILARTWTVEERRPAWPLIAPAVQDAWERAQGRWGERDDTPSQIVWNLQRPSILRVKAPKD
jgi:hypothetical protein